MAELIPLPLTAAQKIRTLARQYDGMLTMQVSHFGLACKLQYAGYTVAFPIMWETIESCSILDLCHMIDLLLIGESHAPACH